MDIEKEFPVYESHNRCCGHIWCIKDICGILCVILTWMLILYAEFVVMFVVYYPSPYPVYSTINVIIFNALAVLAVSAHVRTMLTDPGAVPKGNATRELIQSVNQFIICINREWKECTTFSPPATVILLLFLIFEAMLFATFTAVMFGTQIQAIWHDETGIEQLKKEEARWVKKSRWKSIQAVFGRFSVAWFSPFTTPRQSTGKGDGFLYSV
uniref:Palmitoyltransferase n=1 Tax=Strigamia maritima TaxID=126957 RepID=T1ISB8_STRMM